MATWELVERKRRRVPVWTILRNGKAVASGINERRMRDMLAERSGENCGERINAT